MSTLATLNAGTEDLEQLVLLLDRASRDIWSDADHAGTGSPLHSLGLGVFLAQGQAAELLPEGHVISDLHPQVLDETLGRDLDDAEPNPLQQLRAAEEITRAESLQYAELPGLSQLVADLCDLIREASSVGY